MRHKSHLFWLVPVAVIAVALTAVGVFASFDQPLTVSDKPLNTTDVHVETYNPQKTIDGSQLQPQR